ncbi:molybdopterin-dependent oxidoreductase [Streptomyces sp. NPDC097704]|uniref:molybdopterin oxidoreductase family protein n=1 Tax=Streptomyces sp. NPDC097704 TaxID=3157101 RepID=UPI0033196B94
MRPRPGTNVALFHGLAHVLVHERLVHPGFLRDRATGLDELTELLADHPPERDAGITGVPADGIRKASRLYGRAERPAVLCGLGVTEHLHGTDGVRTPANLPILRGAVSGTGHGFGISPLRGQNNVQGASDTDALPDLRPGYGRVTDSEVRARAETVWGRPVPPTPGLHTPQMFEAAREGRLRALRVIGEDVCATAPHSRRVAALDACPLAVADELFLSGTARHADVVLPVASWLEKDGTFVNFDRRFQRVRAAVRPPGTARTDFEVVHAVATATGADLGCPTPADALAECGRVAPVFAGLSHAGLDREGAVPWPCPPPDRPGEATLYAREFAPPDGRAHLSAAPCLPPGEAPDADYPLRQHDPARRQPPEPPRTGAADRPGRRGPCPRAGLLRVPLPGRGRQLPHVGPRRNRDRAPGVQGHAVRVRPTSSGDWAPAPRGVSRGERRRPARGCDGAPRGPRCRDAHPGPSAGCAGRRP